jgi:hypothetical protein
LAGVALALPSLAAASPIIDEKAKGSRKTKCKKEFKKAHGKCRKKKRSQRPLA